MDALAQSAGRLDVALSLPPGKGFSILLRSYALIRGLWQSFPVDAVDDRLPTDLHVEMSEALLEYWRGALA